MLLIEAICLWSIKIETTRLKGRIKKSKRWAFHGYPDLLFCIPFKTIGIKKGIR